MSEQQTPLSEARLAEIREALAGAYDDAPIYRAFKVEEMLRDLLAEVDRLRAIEAREREIVRAVAAFDDDDSYDGAYKCHWCSAVYDGVSSAPAAHAPDCPVSQARALLAEVEGGERESTVVGLREMRLTDADVTALREHDERPSARPRMVPHPALEEDIEASE